MRRGPRLEGQWSQGPEARLSLGRVVPGILSTSGCADLSPLAVAPAMWVQTQPQLPFLCIPGAPVICKASKPWAQLPLFGHTDAPRKAPCRQAPHLQTHSGSVSCRPSRFILYTPSSGCSLPAKYQANENPWINARKMTIFTSQTLSGKRLPTLPPPVQ